MRPFGLLWALCAFAVCGVSMTRLQLYWGTLIVKQLKKLLAPPPDSDPCKERYAQHHHQDEVKVLI